MATVTMSDYLDVAFRSSRILAWSQLIFIFFFNNFPCLHRLNNKSAKQCNLILNNEKAVVTYF